MEEKENKYFKIKLFRIYYRHDFALDEKICTSILYFVDDCPIPHLITSKSKLNFCKSFKNEGAFQLYKNCIKGITINATIENVTWHKNNQNGLIKIEDSFMIIDRDKEIHSEMKKYVEKVIENIK